MPKAKDIVDIEVSYPGSTADINIFINQKNKFHPQQGFRGEKADQGGKNIRSFHKRKRKQELNDKKRKKIKLFPVIGYILST
jgi:hypothetical protein